MRNLVRASVLLLALVLSEPVLAGQLEDADAAYDKEDYATALRLLRPLAAQGDAGAQFMLGGMYDNGRGVPKVPGDDQTEQTGSRCGHGFLS